MGRRTMPPINAVRWILPCGPDEVLFAVVVDDVGGGLAPARVHPHVQRSVERVGEAAFPLVELL